MSATCEQEFESIFHAGHSGSRQVSLATALVGVKAAIIQGETLESYNT